MHRRNFTIAALVSLGLSGCASAGYRGPTVNSVVVNKAARKMYLLHDDNILREYVVDLGFAPDGAKRIEGDGKTPEGTYWIDRRNPNSSYHLSLGVSYPNASDRAKARALGKSPGGEIFIHGEPNNAEFRYRAARVRDWTAGCIAVKNHEIEEIYAMVSNGTLITIRP